MSVTLGRRAERVVDVGEGASVTLCRTLAGRAVMVDILGRAHERTAGLPGEAANALVALAICERLGEFIAAGAVTAWAGVVDETGEPAALTPEALAELPEAPMGVLAGELFVFFTEDSAQAAVAKAEGSADPTGATAGSPPAGS